MSEGTTVRTMDAGWLAMRQALGGRPVERLDGRQENDGDAYYAWSMQTAGIALAQAMVESLARTLHAQVIETHISWVLLTRDLAYKIKKPVHLPFVDYGTLEARRGFCEEEVRLNRRLAASLYLGVSRITGTHRMPEVDGAGTALEYAVRMLRFAPGALFGEQLAAGALTPGAVDSLALLLGDFHESAPATADGNGFGSAERRRAVAFAALDGAAPVLHSAERARLGDWLASQAAALGPLWSQRLAAGRVRECHGDLHLDNVVSLDDGVAAFDCIEFDPALRWIDVVDDIAFPIMDFGARGRSDFAFRLLSGWLDRTGDHGGMPALRFSAVYRALVRAQVEHLRGADRAAAAARRFVDAALHWTQPPSPRLVITHGLPGSGKTFQSQRLLESEGAIRLRSDVERKRLFGLGMLEDSRSHGVDLYNAEATARTYQHLFCDGALAAAGRFPGDHRRRVPAARRADTGRSRWRVSSGCPAPSWIARPRPKCCANACWPDALMRRRPTSPFSRS